MLKTLNKLKELKDPLCFGRTYDNHTRGDKHTKEKWRELMTKMGFGIEIDLKIICTGGLD